MKELIVKSSLKTIALLGLVAALPSQAWANNDKCEILLTEIITDESGRGGATVASYRPADDFLKSVFDKKTEIFYEVDGHPIRAVMCSRFDIIPSEADYKILATGVPFVLSQNFDMKDSDLLTMFYQNQAFRYDYKGPGLTEETQALLETRLAKFSEKNHGLDKKERAKKDKAAKAKAKTLEKDKEKEKADSH